MPSLSSSNLSSCDWLPSQENPDVGTLSVTFHSGRTYRYANVPQDAYRGLLEAPSAGRYFNSFVKGVYDEV